MKTIYSLGIIASLLFGTFLVMGNNYEKVMPKRLLGATPVLTTGQGGTGTSSPSGILYGDNGSTGHLNTVTVGTGLTFSGGTLSASAGSGEANTASSLGTGLNLFDSKSSVDLRFNTLAAGTNVTLSTSTDSNTIVISSTGGSGGAFAWAPTTWGVSTSTTLGFLNGFLSTASSTVTGTLSLSTTTVSNLNAAAYVGSDRYPFTQAGFQQAINDVHGAGGGIVSLAPGVLTLTSEITIPFDPHLTIQGARSAKGYTGEVMTGGGTIIKASGSFTNLFNMTGNTASANSDLSHDLIVRDVYIEGNDTATNCFYLKNADFVKFEDVRIRGCSTAIETAYDGVFPPTSATKPGGIYVVNSTIGITGNTPNSHHIALRDQTQNRITNTWFSGSASSTVLVASSTKLYISGSEFNTSDVAIELTDSANASTNDVTVTNSVFAVGATNYICSDTRTNSLSNRVVFSGNTYASGLGCTLRSYGGMQIFQPLTTLTNGNFSIMPDGTGKVGIGTTTPQTLFHVYGATPILSIDASNGLTPSLQFRRTGASGQTSWEVVNNAGVLTFRRSTNLFSTIAGTDLTLSATGLATMGYASTTGLSGTFLCLSTDCRTSWPATGLLSYDAWTHPGAGQSATTSELWTAGLLSTASSTLTSTLRLPSLSDGNLAVFGGLVGSYATTTAGTGLTYSAGAFNVNTSQSISQLSNLTSNGFVKTGSSNGTLSVDTNAYTVTSRTITVAGTANQISSSAGAQSLAANRTWTLSIPTQFNISQASTTAFSALWAKIGSTASTTIGTDGSLVTPSLSVSGDATISGTLKTGLDKSFTYSTSTAWTGTTTIPLGPAYRAETWNGVQCFTNAGTVDVSFYDGTNRMNLFNASTTVGTVTLSTNNTFTASETRYVDIGNPATSPTKVSCTVNLTN